MVDSTPSHTCDYCGKDKWWYFFRYPMKIGEPKHCLACLDKKRVEGTIELLINKCMKNKMTDLRNHLFESLELLKENKIDRDQAKAICEVAQTIINTAKVEVEAVRVLGGSKRSEFLQIESSMP